MGVKKSTVCTSASSSERRYTPASSQVANPTSTLGSICRGSRVSTRSSTAGPSLLAQPAALLASVSLGFLASAVSLATLSPLYPHSGGGFTHYSCVVIPSAARNPHVPGMQSPPRVVALPPKSLSDGAPHPPSPQAPAWGRRWTAR